MYKSDSSESEDSLLLEEANHQSEKMDDSTKSVEGNKISNYEVTKRENIFKRFGKWLTADKQRLWSFIFLAILALLIIILAILNDTGVFKEDLGSLLSKLIDTLENKVGLIGIYIGVFVISIFGNFTVIFPVPYTLALVAAASRSYVDMFDIFLMGICAGAGAAIGEVSAWFIGKVSKGVVEDGMEKQVARAQKWIDKGLAPFIIFIFAATPLPDDAILVFIGLLGYALWKTLIWCFLGKIVLTTGTGLAAKYLVGTNVGKWLFWAFGLNPDGSAGEPTPAWLSAITWLATIAIIGVMLFIDWGAIFNKISINILKGKYRKLVNTEKEKSDSLKTNEQNGDISELIEISKRTSQWQCAIKSKNDRTSDYHDFISLSYVLGKSTNILLKPDWWQKLQNNIEEEKFDQFKRYNVEKIILPSNLKEFYNENGKLDELTNNIIFISFVAEHPESNKKYKTGFLLEKIAQNQIKVRCISEKQGIAIKSLKSIPSDLLVSKFLDLLNNIVEQPEVVQKIKYADKMEVQKEESIEI